MRKLIVRSHAQLDIEEAIFWYENQRPSLGIEFLEAVDNLVDRIVRSPYQFPEIQVRVRRALVQRFPYSLYFSPGEESIEVIAVLHQHRHAGGLETARKPSKAELRRANSGIQLTELRAVADAETVRVVHGPRTSDTMGRPGRTDRVGQGSDGYGR